jgi:co-chaperonin GroES (HSP10)
MNITYEPLFDRVLIKLDDPVEKVGSIYVPMSKEDRRAETGTVIAVGNKIETLNEGDRVVMSHFSGTELDNGLIIMKETDVLMRIKGEVLP